MSTLLARRKEQLVYRNVTEDVMDALKGLRTFAVPITFSPTGYTARQIVHTEATIWLDILYYSMLSLHQ